MANDHHMASSSKLLVQQQTSAPGSWDQLGNGSDSRFIPDIFSKPLHPQTPCSWTGHQSRSAALHRTSFKILGFILIPFLYSETNEWSKDWANLWMVLKAHLWFSHTEDKAKWSSQKRDSMTKGYGEGSGQGVSYVSWQLKEYNQFFSSSPSLDGLFA